MLSSSSDKVFIDSLHATLEEAEHARFELDAARKRYAKILRKLRALEDSEPKDSIELVFSNSIIPLIFSYKDVV